MVGQDRILSTFVRRLETCATRTCLTKLIGAGFVESVYANTIVVFDDSRKKSAAIRGNPRQDTQPCP